MAIMFISLLKASYNGYPIHRENALSFDAQLMNKNEDQREELTCGLGLQKSLEKFGYGFLASNRDIWSAWKFHPDIEHLIPLGVWKFRKRYQKSYTRVADTAAFHGCCHELINWLANNMSVNG